jgi:hypothetical protein
MVASPAEASLGVKRKVPATHYTTSHTPTNAPIDPADRPVLRRVSREDERQKYGVNLQIFDDIIRILHAAAPVADLWAQVE